MQRFIDECKNTIKEIINVASRSNNKIKINFAIVGYRDHEMAKSNITIRLKQLCEEKMKKIKEIPNKNFHQDMISEQDFILLGQRLQKKYEEKKNL